MAVDNETIEDYARFPDPQEYLIGFVSGQETPVIKEEPFSSKVSTKNQAKRNSNISSQQSRNSGGRLSS